MITTQLRDYQQIAFDQLKDETSGALMMDMGTGKTLVSLSVAWHKYMQAELDLVVVICPSSLKAQWAYEEIPKHFRPVPPAVVWTAKRKSYEACYNFIRLHQKGLQFLIINVEAFSTMPVRLQSLIDLINQRDRMIIIDESNRIKSEKARRSRNIRKVFIRGPKMILTGTPINRTVDALWPQYDWVKVNLLGTYREFQSRHVLRITGTSPVSQALYRSTIRPDTWKQILGDLERHDQQFVLQKYGLREYDLLHIQNSPSFNPNMDVDGILTKINPYTYRIRKEDCLDLPPKTHMEIQVPMSRLQKQIYADLKKELLAEFMGKELSVLNRLSLTTRLFQVCGGFFPWNVDDSEWDEKTMTWTEETKKKESMPIGNPPDKVAKLIELIQEYEDERPIVVWARFIVEINCIRDHLIRAGFSAEAYNGKVPIEARGDIITRFRDGDTQILVANQSTAGVGLNLQHCTTQYFYSNSFSVAERIQSEDRSHRIGVQGTCTYIDLITEDSIEQRIVDNIKSGVNVIDDLKGRRTLVDLLEA